MVKDHSAREETRYRHINFYFQLAARVLLYASSHRIVNGWGLKNNCSVGEIPIYNEVKSISKIADCLNSMDMAIIITKLILL